MGEWISVEDRLPEKRDYYLVRDSDNDMDVKWFELKDGTWILHSTYKDANDSMGYSVITLDNFYFAVTHWMPLPGAPA
jgi:hypothetical protein